MVTNSMTGGRFAAMRRAALAAVVGLGLSGPARAITLTIDYSYDTSNFFGAGNPSGAAAGNLARASVEAVADFYSSILDDTFAAVTIPSPFPSQVFNGVAFWDTVIQFTHPATGALTPEINGQTRAVDEYPIYVGARNLAGNLGVGGPVQAGWFQDYTGDGFTQSELDQIDAITDTFSDAVEVRGQGLEFSAWGGVLSFDTVGPNWHYNHNTAPGGTQSDFYSVAIHELGHALGLGTSDQWSAYTAGPNFTGPAAIAEYGSAPPLHPAKSHWASGTMSTVLGTNTPQEAAMDPEVTQGTRKVLTDLDAAGLTDLGWEVTTPAPIYHPADFNTDTEIDSGDFAVWKLAFGQNAGADADDDGDSDGRDFLIWQRSIGQPTPPGAAVPEPGAIWLAVLGVGAIGDRKRAWRQPA